MTMPNQQPEGWKNWKAYPLLVDRMSEEALVKLQAAQNLSRGKALNVAIREGLTALGYLTRVIVCNPHQWRPEWDIYGDKYERCTACKEVRILERREFVRPEGGGGR